MARTRSGSAQGRPAQRRSVQGRSIQRSLGSIVLGFELVVVFLGALVVFGLKALPAASALGGGAAMVIAMAATIALLRFRWAFTVAWILQLIVVASGFLNPVLFIVGVLFTGLWAYCMITGARLDRQSPQHPSPEHPPTDTPPTDPQTETETPS